MTTRADLSVDPRLVEFVETDLLPGLDVSADRFWEGLAKLVAELGPRNRALLDQRDQIQTKIDG
jgi:malate synthase